MQKAHIWQNINDLAKYLEIFREDYTHYQGEKPKIVVTSGGYDPCHQGHIWGILSSAKLGQSLTVIVNGDGFLVRKKGYYFMSLYERMEIISSLSGVDNVVSWDDGTQFVDGALAILKPNIFTKGGDRSCETAMASSELAVCHQIGCKIVYGVGGTEKLQSSSTLCSRLRSLKINNDDKEG